MGEYEEFDKEDFPERDPNEGVELEEETHN